MCCDIDNLKMRRFSFTRQNANRILSLQQIVLKTREERSYCAQISGELKSEASFTTVQRCANLYSCFRF